MSNPKKFLAKTIEEISQNESLAGKPKKFALLSFALSFVSLAFSIITIFFATKEMTGKVFLIRFVFAFFAFVINGFSLYFSTLQIKLSKNVVAFGALLLSFVCFVFTAVSACV